MFIDMRGREVDYFEKGELREYAVKLILAAIAAAVFLILLAIMAYIATFMSLQDVLSAIISSAILFIGIILGGFVMFMVLRLYGMMRMMNQIVTRSIKVSENRLPGIYGIAKLASERLGVKQPDIYVVQDPLINAFAVGSRKKFIVLNTALIEAMSEKESLFVIGHELSHIKYGIIAWIRIAGIRVPVPIVFRSKFREYTCDRGGLIACRDPDASIMALARLALGKKLADEIDVKTLYVKDEEVKKERGLKPFERLASHPQVKDRINRLRKFGESELYKELTSDTR